MHFRPRRLARLAALVAAAVLLLTVALLSATVVGTHEPVVAVAEPSPVATPSAPESTPSTTTTTAPRQVRVVMSGDLLWHNSVWYSAAEDHRRTGRGVGGHDWDPMFARVKPLIQAADVAICHEEVPFARPGQAPSNYPLFAAPRSIAAWIASMGWDACTTASNHAWDGDLAGLLTTADLLHEHGVPPVGTFRSEQERLGPPVTLTTADGVSVAIVAATYSLNGFEVPTDEWWSVSELTEVRDDLLTQARRAREAGADIVIAHVHWGTEYDAQPDATQVALADALAASPDVDLVLGEHAHVVQPITRLHGTWVVYGMGNMVAQSEITRPTAYEGISVDFRFTEQSDGSYEVTRAAYVPTQWNHYRGGDPIRIVPATGAHLASIRAAVGQPAGLVEDTLP